MARGCRCPGRLRAGQRGVKAGPEVQEALRGGQALLKERVVLDKGLQPPPQRGPPEPLLVKGVHRLGGQPERQVPAGATTRVRATTVSSISDQLGRIIGRAGLGMGLEPWVEALRHCRMWLLVWRGRLGPEALLLTQRSAASWSRG
jgi:hypothetical protein